MSNYPVASASMAKTNTFNLFTASGKDLSAGNALEHSIGLVNKSRSAEGVVFSPSIIVPVVSTKGAALKPRGQLKTSFATAARYLGAFTVDSTIQTDASKASSIALKWKNVIAKQAPGVNAGITITTSEKDLPAVPKYGVFETVSVDYSRPYVTTSASFTSDMDRQHSASAALSVGKDGFAVGGDVKVVRAAKVSDAVAGEDANATASRLAKDQNALNSATFVPKEYNVGAAYTYGQYTGAIVSERKLNALKATLLAKKLGTNGVWNLGAQYKVDLVADGAKPKVNELVLGVEELATPMTSYRLAYAATGANKGWWAANCTHKLRGTRDPNMLLDVSVITKPESTYKPWNTQFGAAITFGDY